MNEFDLFQSALDIADPTARQQYLRSQCEHNGDLLRRVEALLLSHESQSQFMQAPVVEQMVNDAANTMVIGNDSTCDDDHAATAADRPKRAPRTELEGEATGDDGGDTDGEIPLGYLTPSTKPGSLGRLGHYEVQQVIGRGAFGTVLRAFDEKLHRVVAIKVMSSEMAVTSPARKRFLREAQASAAIRHEHVVSVYAVEEQPLPYLVMEYIPGVTLQQRLDERGPLDLPNVLRLGRQIAEGLAAAHSQQLIHRDIKPGNILLEAGIQDRVKITDFGLARAADDASLTQSGTIAGTPMYMAPEQAHGNKLDQRADLFSLGSVLYQMVSGRPPFRAPSALAVLKRVTEEMPRPIQEIIPETPGWLCDIITKLHSKNPDDRYQSAREVADVLANCEEQLKVHSSLKDFSRIPSTNPPRSARRRLLIAGGVLGAMLLGIIVITIKNKDGVETRIEVPEGTEIRVQADQDVAGTVPANTPSATTATTAAIANVPRSPGAHWPAESPKPALAPFDPEKAREHQAACARQLGVEVEITNSVGMKLRLIPPGEQQSTQARRPRSESPFYLGRTEVTVEQYRQFVDATGYRTIGEVTGTGGKRVQPDKETAATADLIWSHSDFAIPADRPVTLVTWHDAMAYCDWLSRKEGRIYRLPTRSEWNWAARAGSDPRSEFGKELLKIAPYAWYLDNSDNKAHPVGTRLPNSWGMFDMFGNVWEFVSDWRQSGDPNAIDTSFDGPGANDTIAFIGGSFNDPSGSTAGAVASSPASIPYSHQGFRVALVGEFSAKQPLPAPAFTNSIGMEFVNVPRGRSWLGGGRNRPGDKEVEISSDFYLGRYEVTQAEWEKVMGENPSAFSRRGQNRAAVEMVSDDDLNRFPVEMVSWDQCQILIAKLNSLEQQDSGWVYRLPSEVEWEYACRGGPMSDRSESAFSYYLDRPTNTLSLEQGNFRNAYGYNPSSTCKVGSYRPNSLGLFDMHGNVWELCNDTYRESNPTAPHVFRGGYWWTEVSYFQASARNVCWANYQWPRLGLRLGRFPAKAPVTK